MNYLAHVALARPTPEARLGALLGDFARGLDLDAWPAETRAAVLEHRAVDRWVDAHPRVRAARAAFPPGERRFAGIALDVFWDHFLVRHWDRVAPAATLSEVTSGLYDALELYADRLPPRLARVAPRMAAEDWLASYGDPANVERALQGLARRFSRPTPLAAGARVLHVRYAELEEDFLALYPELGAFVERSRG